MRAPTKFVEALLSGDLKTAGELLPITDLHLGFAPSGWTALQNYGATGVTITEFKMTELLLKYGGNPDLLSEDGRTPLAIALHYSFPELVTMLKRSSMPEEAN